MSASEIKQAELLQAVDISHALLRNALEKKSITYKDVERACSHGREMMEKLGQLRLMLHGIEPE